MIRIMIVTAIASLVPVSASAQYYGNWTSNPYGQNRVNPSTYSGGQYGTSSNSPGLYSSDGQFRGNLNSNRYDPNSVANPYGQYGSRYSPDSVNNPYGAGSQYNQNSPSNRYGSGLMICGINGCN